MTWTTRTKPTFSLTWAEATMTWEEATFTWEGWTSPSAVSSSWSERTSFLLTEAGGFLLWEDGTKIVLEGAEGYWGDRTGVSSSWSGRTKPTTNWT